MLFEAFDTTRNNVLLRKVEQYVIKEVYEFGMVSQLLDQKENVG